MDEEEAARVHPVRKPGHGRARHRIDVFPETNFKFYLDASLDERSKRRAAEGVKENLAARDQRDSQRRAAPLIVPLGAMIINNSSLTSEQTSGIILEELNRRLQSLKK